MGVLMEKDLKPSLIVKQMVDAPVSMPFEPVQACKVSSKCAPEQLPKPKDTKDSSCQHLTKMESLGYFPCS